MGDIFQFMFEILQDIQLQSGKKKQKTKNNTLEALLCCGPVVSFLLTIETSATKNKEFHWHRI